MRISQGYTLNLVERKHDILICRQSIVDEMFCITFQSLETLYSRLVFQRDEGADTNLPKGDAENDLLRILSYKAESVSKEAHLTH